MKVYYDKDADLNLIKKLNVVLLVMAHRATLMQPILKNQASTSLLLLEKVAHHGIKPKVQDITF